jgi:hypothetical protein
MAYGALTIGTGDMNAFELQIRVSEKLTEGTGVGKVFLIGSRANPAEHGQPGKKIVDGLLVIHSGKSIKRDATLFLKDGI